MIQDVWFRDISRIPINEEGFCGDLKDYDGFYTRIEEVELQDIYDRVEDLETKMERERKDNRHKQYIEKKYTKIREDIEKGRKLQLVALKFNEKTQNMSVYDGRHRLHMLRKMFGSGRIPVVVLYLKKWVEKNKEFFKEIRADNIIKAMPLMPIIEKK